MTTEEAQALFDAYAAAVQHTVNMAQGAQEGMGAAKVAAVGEALDRELLAARRLIAAIMAAGTVHVSGGPAEEVATPMEPERELYDAVLRLHEETEHYQEAQQRLNALVADFASHGTVEMRYCNDGYVLPLIVGPSGDTWEVRRTGDRASIQKMPPAILIRE